METPSHNDIEHKPVMLDQVLELLDPVPGGIYVDGTVGLGGHSEAIVKRIQPGGLLVGLDRDRESLDKAAARLAPFGSAVRLVHDNFKNLPLVLNNLGTRPVDGILLDLGVSSFQLLSPERGFSFQSDAMLDMRMDRSQRVTAAHLVNELGQEELANIIYQYGEERLSRRIAAAIVAAREQGPVTRCAQLADIVTRALKVRSIPGFHPATRTFQALRIAVNQELEGLQEFMADAITFLKPGGKLAVIAFHSLEDRIVKHSFRMLAGQCVCERPPELCLCPRREQGRLLTPRALKPGAAEVAGNPRARSARLRGIERV
jgi:16S rRNA (cytosine1402-N4)-methyltransferase